MAITFRSQQYVDIKSAAAVIGASERHVRRCCVAGELAGAKQEKGKWLIPVTAHPRLAAAGTGANIRFTPASLQNVAASKRELAISRLGMLTECDKFVASLMGCGSSRQEALAAFAAKNNIGLRTLQRWMSDFKREGITALVDGRGGVTTDESFSADAKKFFEALYLTEQRLSVAICYSMTVHHSKTHGLEWEIPSLRSVQNHAASVPEHIRVLYREGKAAYDARFAPYIQRDPESILPGAWWTGDHHQFNLFIRHRGQWVRPWITAWEDMGSRAIVGWYISTGPNQTTILQAMRRGIEKFGPPDSVKIDNGKDYDSRMFTGVTKSQRRSGIEIDESLVTGIYGMMGITASFAIAYHPQAKPIERLFDTLDCQFTKTFKTYCGKDSDRKPEDLQGYLKTEKAVAESPSLEDFSAKLEKWVEAYNNTAHGGAGMDGRTPMEVLNSRTSRRVVEPAVLDMLLCVWSGELKVGKNGIRWMGMNYGQFEHALVPGTCVRIAYNPDDVRTVAVYNAENLTFICHASQNQLIKYGDTVSEEFVREAHAKKASMHRIAKAYRDASAVAGLDITELAISAKNDAAREAAGEDSNIRPVATPLDGQAREYGRQKRQSQFKLAAGAESMSLGLGNISNEPKPLTRLGLLDE
jgi:transposase InsO family protein